MSTFEPLAYQDGNTALTGLLARPAGTPKAAIAVYPNIMNPTQSVKEKALALAEAGYLALICDFYGKQPEDFGQAAGFAEEIRETSEMFRQRVRAGITALTSLDDAKGLPVAAIGFCMGGRAVLELAREGAALAAVVSFHGILDTDMPATPGAITARILICHGDGDELVPRSRVIAFWEEMDEAKANWHFHSYAGVPHSFTNHVLTDGKPPASYDASADRQSWAAMHSLFDELFS